MDSEKLAGVDEDGTAHVRGTLRHGRGACSNASGRHERESRLSGDDGWIHDHDEPVPPLRTTVTTERARSIITKNTSPDVPFDRSINPYRGCEHGCIYCYARPSHANMGLSAGLDFETRLFAKPDAAKLLRKELARPGYRPRPIAIGTNTDPYQPIEREHQIMRSILDVLDEASHPVTIVTKSALVCRDIDILSSLAKRNLVKVALSVTTLDRHLARRMEPRASTPARRLDAIARLSDAGIPTGVMVAPIIPALTDHELEAILEAARRHGATEAGWVMLRLPMEVSDLFLEWLKEEYPERAARIMGHLKGMRDGKANDPRFGHRMRGHGPYADMIKKRFRLAAGRLRLNRRLARLDCTRFCPPGGDERQGNLFAGHEIR